MLRANDLIWSFVVNNYLLGKQPFPFDLLYWNSDSTRMPAAMHSFYLRNMYQENLLVKPGGITLGGVPIDLRKIKTPAFLLSTREDHIAPWRSTYAATQLYSGPVKFVLSASGHIAGVVNPPGSKYGHWQNDNNPPTPEEWLAGATADPDSWWPAWEQLGVAICRRRGAGAPARRRQAQADRGRARLLRQGPRRRLTPAGFALFCHGRPPLRAVGLRAHCHDNGDAPDWHQASSTMPVMAFALPPALRHAAGGNRSRNGGDTWAR